MSFVALLLAGCGSTGGHVDQTQSETPAERGSSGATTSVSLPIARTFESRTNYKNNGSEYEPCIAVSPLVAASIGLKPETIEDVASIPRDGIRGCKWRSQSESGGWAMTQAVSNWSSLARFREFNQLGSEWLPAQEIRRREVGVYREHAGSPMPTCATYVQSGGAGVITMVRNSFRPPSQFDECAKAVEATAAVIDQIPR